MFIATQDAVYQTADAQPKTPPTQLMQRDGVRRVVAGGRSWIVGLADGRVLILNVGLPGETTIRVPEPVESLLVLSEGPLHLLIGTEGAHLFVVKGAEGAEGPARRVETFDKLDCRDKWHTPWGGPPAVRSMAATTDGWVYADIHVGSIMRSPDLGATWEPVTPELNEDVHQVTTCPAADDRVYANTAKGVYLSYDRGGSWQHRAADLNDRYGRAVAVHPEKPDLVLATVSDGPHGDDVRGGLYRTEDGGLHWTHVKDGFPESTRNNINTHRVVFAPDGTAWAGVEESLYVGHDDATRWEKVWEAPGEIEMIACSPPPAGP